MQHPSASPTGLALVTDRTGAIRARAAGSVGAAAVLANTSDARLWAVLLGAPALTPAEAEALNRIAETRQLGHGDMAFSRAQVARSLVALIDGTVSLGMRTADGVFRIERIVHGPAWLDLSSAWLNEPHAMDAQAGSTVTVLDIPREALQAQLERFPMLGRRLIQCLAHEVHALATNTHELMHKDAPGRLAQWLRQRCQPVAGQPGQAVVHLSERKRDVASQLAITPETLSRLMRSFTRQNIIEVAGYTVRVLDLTGLDRLAQA